ncbi:uncharacterized protein LOC144033476 isoform X3 [Festucalex cinctus]
MKTSIVFILAVCHLKVNADVIFMQLEEKQSLELSCPPQQDRDGLTSLHLYHRRGPAQTTLLSLARGAEDQLRLDPDYKRRLRLSRGRNSSWLKVFLLVDASGRPCECSSGYPPLLMTIFSATGLLLIMLLWLAAGECVKARRPPVKGPAAVPIYEEMTRKEQNSGVPLNKQETLEEVTSPLYANTLVRQTQDNYYACPRHVTLRA